VVAFVTHLCDVSLAEIAQPQPRTFSLQKIVEITHYNMNRIRVVWSKVWAVLAKFFHAVRLSLSLCVCV
jgi:brefeldin A-inhibited guanine nucleotide-exchange protein